MREKKDIKVNVQGVSTLGILGVVFVTLKLLGHIGWSWLWVTAPFWAPLGAVAVILGMFLTFAGIVFVGAFFGDAWNGWRKQKRAGLR